MVLTPTRCLLMLLSAAASAVATITSPAAAAASAVASFNSPGNFTAACAADRRKLQMDSNVYKTVLQVVQISTAVVLNVMDSCKKNTTKCSTSFGGGSCCSADGAGQWTKHQPVYEAYESACAKVEEGNLLWFVEQVTIGGSGEPIVQSTYENTLPLYISKKCQSSDNIATLFKALDQDCVSSGGAILKCEYFNASSIQV